MKEEVVNELAAAWKIDRDELFDAFMAAKGAIKLHIKGHADCAQLHVASLLAADYIGGLAQRLEAGGEDPVSAQLVQAAAYSALGQEVVKLSLTK